MGKRIPRRDALKFGALGAGALVAPAGLVAAGRLGPLSGHAAHASFLEDYEPIRGKAFRAELKIPPVLRPTRRSATTDFYDITVRNSTTEIIPGVSTPIWGYNGIMPGPTIEARDGRPVSVTFVNRVPPNEDRDNLIVTEPPDPEDHPFTDSGLVVHAHGINADSPDDGYPEDVFTPGQSHTYHYPNNDYQRPATLWYHDHSVHITGEHVYRGLKAFYILRDDLEDSLPLPRGEFDVPLVVADAIVDRSGRLVYDNWSHHGLIGSFVTVNGRQQPRFAVANRKYRFRLLNGSDAREYLLALDDGSPFTVIGSDHGLFERPVTTRTLRITPAERYEIVVDFSRYPLGRRIVLENRLEDAYPGHGGGDDELTRRVMAFDVTRRVSDDSRIPDRLRPINRIPLSRAVKTRTWLFDRENGYWSINGKQWNPNRVDAFPRLGATEIWRFVNKSGGWSHPVHPHLVRFLMVDVNERRLKPYERGWKDTAWVGPNQEIRVIMTFRNFTGKYAFHCHNSSHEDHDMMTQFQTV
jgi:spore coat protein A, manganese oxidase